MIKVAFKSLKHSFTVET